MTNLLVPKEIFVIPIEYVWIGGYCSNYSYGPLNYIKPFTLRSKTKIIYTSKNILTLEDIPIWNYDGSSTNQSETKKSEVFIAPKAMFNDPFRENGKLVLCDTYLDSECKTPHESNTRYNADKIFSQKIDEEPWYGIEQEFFLMKSSDNYPIGFDSLIPQGQYYCSVGNNNSFGRDIIEKIAKYAIFAGVKLSGWNAEVAPGQWEFQVGPLTGISAGDHLWILRYIMERCTENTPYYIELHPKPIINNIIESDIKNISWTVPTDWNGSGAHTNYSTKNMRQIGGLDIIKKAIDKLYVNHSEHIKYYGEYNNLRLSGKCETSSIDNFTFGVSDRTASIRIPSETVKNGFGYFEDRRPSSLMDPYKVTSMIFATTCL